MDEANRAAATLRPDTMRYHPNRPAAHPDNGRTDDPLGGPGRVYFVSPDGHLFEVTVTA